MNVIGYLTTSKHLFQREVNIIILITRPFALFTLYDILGVVLISKSGRSIGFSSNLSRHAQSQVLPILD